MSDVLISLGSEEASDSWGFVGVVRVGLVEAYRTLEAFPSPTAATDAAQQFMVDVLGELLAGREWRSVRDQKGTAPTRHDFRLSVLNNKQQ